MRQVVEHQQAVPLGREGELGQSAVADAQVQFDAGSRRSTQHMRHRGGNRATAADNQHVAAVLAAHMVQRRHDAGHPVAIGRHACGLDLAAHPGQQRFAQDAEMLAIAFGRVVRRHRAGMERPQQRFAVVLVQCRPLQRLGHIAMALGQC